MTENESVLTGRAQSLALTGPLGSATLVGERSTQLVERFVAVPVEDAPGLASRSCR